MNGFAEIVIGMNLVSLQDMRSSYETASTFMEEEPQVINYKQFKILSMDEETKQREAEIKREVSQWIILSEYTNDRIADN